MKLYRTAVVFLMCMGLHAQIDFDELYAIETGPSMTGPRSFIQFLATPEEILLMGIRDPEPEVRDNAWNAYLLRYPKAWLSAVLDELTDDGQLVISTGCFGRGNSDATVGESNQSLLVQWAFCEYFSIPDPWTGQKEYKKPDFALDEDQKRRILELIFSDPERTGPLRTFLVYGDTPKRYRPELLELAAGGYGEALVALAQIGREEDVPLVAAAVVPDGDRTMIRYGVEAMWQYPHPGHIEALEIIIEDTIGKVTKHGRLRPALKALSRHPVAARAFFDAMIDSALEDKGISPVILARGSTASSDDIEAYRGALRNYLEMQALYKVLVDRDVDPKLCQEFFGKLAFLLDWSNMAPSHCR